MQRRDLESAAAKHTFLRGLYGIPLGLLFTIAALGNWEVGSFAEPWFFILAVLAVFAASLPIVRYYDEHYGRLSPSTHQQLKGLAALAAAVAVMGLGAWALRDAPVNAIAVSFSLVMLISYAMGPGLLPHHYAIWGGLLVIGALPVWTGGDPSNVGLLLAGVGVAISGVLDHRTFVRTFGPATVHGDASA
jgi:hypothetical protein